MVGVPQEDSGDKSVLQKTQEHNQALFRQQQIQKENATVQQQRQNAPGNIKEGTFEAQQVRKEASQDAQQAYFGGGFQQKGSSADSFVAQREAALKSGKFDYSAVKSTFYSPPSTFVNVKGERVARTDYKPPAKEPMTFGSPVSGTPIEKPNQPILKISQSELQTSNDLRASQGLPPLEKVTTVQIVAPTKGPTIQQQSSRLTNKGTPALSLGARLAQAQGSVEPMGGGGEAVSFLRFPFTSNKGASSGGIQSTTILDPLQFLGIEAGVSLATKGAAFVGSLIRSEGKTIIKEGAKDIGLNIKPSEAYLKAKSFEAQAARLPPPATIKPTVTPKTPTVPTFTSSEINIGKGLGRTTGKGGSTTVLDKFKPSPPTKPSPTGGKEVTVGKGGLTQIVKEKPTVKLKESQVRLGSKQTTKPSFEQKQLQKQDQFLKQKLKPKQETILKQKQDQLIIVKPIQKQTQGLIQPPKQKQKQTTGTPIQQKQKQTTRSPPTILRTVTTFRPPTQKQPPAQKQTTNLINPPFFPTVFKIPPRTPPKIPATSLSPPPSGPPTTTEPPKRPPPFPPLLGGAKPGGLLSVRKSGARKGYIGNVPVESIVGVYKRSEVTYTNRSPSQINKKQKTTTNRNFKLLGSKSIKL